MRSLLLLFILVPAVELGLLIRLGNWIGVLPTWTLILATGGLGAVLAHRQGADVLRGIQGDLERGRIPAGSVLDGALIFVGGLLLLTPGLLTDGAGLLLLVPAVRHRIADALRRRYSSMERSSKGLSSSDPWKDVSQGKGEVEDAEFH